MAITTVKLLGCQNVCWGGGAHREALRFLCLMCQLCSPTIGPHTESDADCCHTAPSSSGSALLAGGCEKECLGLGEWPVKGNWVTEASGPNQKAPLSNYLSCCNEYVLTDCRFHCVGTARQQNT